MPIKFNFKKNSLLILHKLLFDALFFVLAFFVLSLFFESVLPGIITTHVGFSQMIISFSVIIIFIYFSGQMAGIEAPAKIDFPKNKKAALAAAIFGILLLNAFLKINILLNFSITLASLACAWFVMKVISEKK